ncbi:MAG: LysR family transcriptional regulator [Thiomonas sp.]|uniref:Putative transcriptional regulator (LysR family) n=1 Tax=mine drainage metagenome TaxID=410659 RepID=E6PVU8_9ZZZZ
MNNPLDSVDLHLIRVLHTVLAESSVSRAAMRLGSTQPAVSSALRRLRAITGDELLVRSGNAMVPTAFGASLIEPTACILREAQRLVEGAGRFDAARSTRLFRLAAADYMDPAFLPQLIATLKREAPQCGVDVLPLSAALDYRHAMAEGEVDVVLGNWLEPPQDLHLAPLLEDEIVCLVAADHPALRRGLDLQQYLQAEHVAPSPLRAAGEGVIDQHLHHLGLQRRIAVHCAFFNLIPGLVARSLLVLTTGRRFCQRYVEAGLAVRILPCPVPFPPLTYYLLWHARAHHDTAHRWLREQVREAASRSPTAT